MSKIQLLNLFITERLTTAAVELFGENKTEYHDRLKSAAVDIFRIVEKTIIEYLEEISSSKQENGRLRRILLDLGAGL